MIEGDGGVLGIMSGGSLLMVGVMIGMIVGVSVGMIVGEVSGAGKITSEATLLVPDCKYSGSDTLTFS